MLNLFTNKILKSKRSLTIISNNFSKIPNKPSVGMKKPTTGGSSIAKPNPSTLKANPLSLKPNPSTLKPNPSALKSNSANSKNSKINTQNIQKQFQVQKKNDFIPQFRKKHAVVTIMGHVDHGKTTLIDYLRKSDIAGKQDGGITQRISAFRVGCLGETITFIDTPGHEAFTNMRARGAQITDIIILVVSATQGVRQQTLQVIKTIKQSGIKTIVAITKMDLAQANPQDVQDQLSAAGLQLQQRGGDVPVVHISAKTGMNVDLLCELVIEQSKDLKAVYNGMAQGFVLQALQTKQRINSMTLVMRKGILKINSAIIVGNQACKVRSILDDQNNPMQQAHPGDAVQVVGIPFIPSPGQLVLQCQSLQLARHIVQTTKAQNQKNTVSQPAISSIKLKFERSRQGKRQKRAFYKGIQQVWMIKFNQQQQKLLNMLEQVKSKQGQKYQMMALQIQQKLQNHRAYVAQYFKSQSQKGDILNFVVKFGDRGMQQTIVSMLQGLKKTIESQIGIKINLISSDVGSVTVSDLQQATTFNARIFTFGAQVSSQAKKYMMQQQNIASPRIHKLIHNLLKDIKDVAYQKKLSNIKGNQKSRCDVAEIFTLKTGKSISGIKVTQGKITKTAKAYIFRNGIPISTGLNIAFLKSFKKDMIQLKKGQEGTIGFTDQNAKIQKGDQLRFYQQN